MTQSPYMHGALDNRALRHAPLIHVTSDTRSKASICRAVAVGKNVYNISKVDNDIERAKNVQCTGDDWELSNYLTFPNTALF